MTQRVLIIPSGTHYGRGEPLTGREVENRLHLGRVLLDLLVPGLPVYSTIDEDYLWIVPLSPEEEAGLRLRYPESLELDGWVYLSTPEAEYDDEFAFEHEGEKHAEQVRIRDVYPHEDKDLQREPLDREKLFADWFDRYGRW